MNNHQELHMETRRDWLRTVGLGGMAAVAGGGSLRASETAQGRHRLELRKGQLVTTVVDNHDGLSGQQQINRRARMPSAADGHGDLFCTVPFEDRYNGYNGVARLRNGNSSSPFLPCAAGHNCEFFFDAGTSSYEPRWSDQPKFLAQPSSLTRLSDSAARLKIEPGPRWGIQVESKLELRDPFYLDIEHSFEPTDSGSVPAVLGVFWANYIQVPRQAAFYFVTPDEQWVNVYDALEHGNSGVIVPASGPVGNQLAGNNSGRGLLFNLAPTRFGRPFYCGNVHGMLLSLMFEPTEEVEIRFAFNPSGGGPGVPAWDYQAVVANPKPGKRYSFKSRTVYKPFEGLEEALELYRSWSA